MQQKIFWLVASPLWNDFSNPVKYITMFTFEGEGDGVFTAYHANESAEEYWNKWLKRRDRNPSNLLDSMSNCLSKMGYVESEEHFQQLLREIGKVSQ
jgi:hypothetical protein